MMPNYLTEQKTGSSTNSVYTTNLKGYYTTRSPTGTDAKKKRLQISVELKTIKEFDTHTYTMKPSRITK
jgi:hypothetical protein